MKNKLILAIVGMAGSGKSETVRYLVKKTGWPVVYFGQPTFDRLKEEGLEINYANEKMIREKIRAEMGMGAYAELNKPAVRNLIEANDNVIVESLYSWDEYKIMKEEFGDIFKVLAVFASPAVRFARLKNRQNERPISGEEEFIARDYSEIENTSKAGPIARADYTIINESDIVNLHSSIESLGVLKG